MASIDEVDSEIEIKRPRRSCTQKEEIEQKENSENSDSEELEETPENSNDEDFSLNKPRKAAKKKKKVKKEKKIEREFPSYFSVMQAQKALEEKLAVRNMTQSNEDNDYSSDESDKNCIKEELPKEEPVEDSIEPPQPEQTKKKRIVIRPWNPQWYQIKH